MFADDVSQGVPFAPEGTPDMIEGKEAVGQNFRGLPMMFKKLAYSDVEIVETHHNLKADAPTGTAKLLLSAVDPEGARPVVYGREGMVGARPSREIGMHSLRGGTEAGTHEVHFFGTDEEVCLTHRATSRRVFVSGAVAAAKRIRGGQCGWYDYSQWCRCARRHDHRHVPGWHYGG